MALHPEHERVARQFGSPARTQRKVPRSLPPSSSLVVIERACASRCRRQWRNRRRVLGMRVLHNDEHKLLVRSDHHLVLRGAHAKEGQVILRRPHGQEHKRSGKGQVAAASLGSAGKPGGSICSNCSPCRPPASPRTGQCCKAAGRERSKEAKRNSVAYGAGRPRRASQGSAASPEAACHRERLTDDMCSAYFLVCSTVMVERRGTPSWFTIRMASTPLWL